MTQKDGIIALIAFVLATIIVGGVAFAVNRSSRNVVLFDSIPGFAVADDRQESEPEDPLALLLLGVGGDNHDGGTLTDTIMIVEISPDEQAIKLVSLPRDFLVFDEEGFYYKINAFYPNRVQEVGEEQAMEELQAKIAEITGIETDHYAQIDFGGFVELIDTLGGVEVEVTETIDDPLYPGPNFSYDPFFLEVGTQTLDGETALKYARSRYSSEGGDLDRARRQQQIIAEVRTKAFELNPVWDIGKITSLISLANQNLETDLSLAAMKKLYDAYRGIDDYQLVSYVVGADLLQGSLEEGFRQFGAARGYILEPRAGEQNYLQIRQEVANILRQDAYFAEIDEIRSESPSVLVVSWLDPEETQEVTGMFESQGMQVSAISPQGITSGDGAQIGNGLYVNAEQDLDSTGRQSAAESYFVREFDTKQLTEQDARVLSTHRGQGTDYILYLSRRLPYQE